GLHQPEFAHPEGEVPRQLLPPGAAGFCGKVADDLPQVVLVFHQGLRVDPAQVDQLVVEPVAEGVVLVQHEGETARHAGAKVRAAAAQHGDDATGHVFAAVVAGSLHDGN